jgi:hypothetical protein
LLPLFGRRAHLPVIDALEQRWGPNWVQQQYRRSIDQLMAAHGVGGVFARLFSADLPADAPAGSPLPEGAGWNTFVWVGEETARQIVRGVLLQTGTSDPEYRQVLSPDDVPTYVQRHQAGGLTRQRLVSVAAALCGRHRGAADWTAFLQSTTRGLPP